MKLNHKLNPVQGTKQELNLIEHKITHSAVYFKAYVSYVSWFKLVGGKKFVKAKIFLQHFKTPQNKPSL